jgi:glycosyltransferase involved in cell wall biosynthesis
MRIAVYYNLNFGGAKRVVFEQVKGLCKKGHIIDLYLISKEEDIFDPVKYVKKVFKYNYNENLTPISLFSKLQKDINVFVRLKKLHSKIAKDIDSNNYDLVFVHPDKLTQAPYLLRFLKTKSVYYCEEPLRIVYEYSLRFNENTPFIKRGYEKLNRSIRKDIDLKNVRAAGYSLASCFHVRERMIEVYDVYPKVSYPGIDSNIFKTIKSSKKNQIIFVGDKKVVTDGYDLAYNSLKLIPSNIRPELKIISWKKNNNERLSDEELVKIYNQSVAVFCLSRLETFGLVPLEAMSCGVPVIATNVSGHRETILQEETGYLVDFDPKEISSRVMFLLKNPAMAKKMGANGRNWIERRWTWEKANEELNVILNSISLDKTK